MGQCIVKPKEENQEDIEENGNEDMTGSWTQEISEDKIPLKKKSPQVASKDDSNSASKVGNVSKESNVSTTAKLEGRSRSVVKMETEEKNVKSVVRDGTKEYKPCVKLHTKDKKLHNVENCNNLKKNQPIVEVSKSKIGNTYTTEKSISVPGNNVAVPLFGNSQRFKGEVKQISSKCAIFEKIIEDNKLCNSVSQNTFNKRNVDGLPKTSTENLIIKNVEVESTNIKSSKGKTFKFFSIYSPSNKSPKENEHVNSSHTSTKSINISTIHQQQFFIKQISSSINNCAKWKREEDSGITNKQIVSERTVNVETRKVKKSGKWHEETVKTLTHTDEKGTTTNSRKANYRELLPEEVEEHESFIRGETPGISPTNETEFEPEPEPEPEPEIIEVSKKPKKENKKPTIKKVPAKLKKKPPAVKKKPEIVKRKDDPETFSRQVIASVNGYRRSHDVPPLIENEELNKMAAEWAERLASMEKMEHGDKKGLGENIYCKTSSQPFFPMSGEEVVENWYNEVEDHDYNEEPNPGYLKTGHFTQLIWADTKEMGVAYARNKNGHMAFVVSYFSPKGNWIGEFRDKVPPPGGFTNVKNESSIAKATSGAPSNRRTLPPIMTPPSSADGLELSSRNKRSKNLSEAPPLPPRNTRGGKYDFHSDRLAETPYVYNPDPSKKQSRNRSKTPSISSRKSTADSYKSFQSSRSIDTPNIYSSPTSSRYKAASISSRKNTAISTASSPSQKSIPTSLKSVEESPRIMSKDFAEQFLEAHNSYRRKHGVSPLTLSEKICVFAQKWAEENAELDKMEHKEDNDYGENIYMKWSPNKNDVMLGSEPVDSWYSEIQNYDFGEEPLDLSAGHFTQIVWADTEEVGVGMAKSASGKTYVIGHYNPPGNYVGQFSRMVPPPEEDEE